MWTWLLFLTSRRNDQGRRLYGSPGHLIHVAAIRHWGLVILGDLGAWRLVILFPASILTPVPHALAIGTILGTKTMNFRPCVKNASAAAS